MANFSEPDFEPMFADNITWHNDSLRQKAEDQCGNDQECLFDVASTNDLSLGLVTKDISIQLVNETKQLSKYLNLSLYLLLVPLIRSQKKLGPCCLLNFNVILRFGDNCIPNVVFFFWYLNIRDGLKLIKYLNVDNTA